MHFSGCWGRSLEVAVIQISSVHSKTGRKQEVVADQGGFNGRDYCTLIACNIYP